MGYKTGAITYEFETKTFNYDRGIRLFADVMDVEEAGVNDCFVEAGAELQRTQVAPEADAFTFAQIAGHTGVTVTPEDLSEATATDILQALREVTSAMDEKQVTLGSDVADMATLFWTGLREDQARLPEPCRRHVAERRVLPVVVVPVHPVEELRPQPVLRRERPPAHQLALEHPVRRLDNRVVVGVAGARDRPLDSEGREQRVDIPVAELRPPCRRGRPRWR